MIKLRDIMPDSVIKKIAEDTIKKRVKEIRAGRVITRAYRPSTVKKRRKHGLQTAHIDLTGNLGYSKHPWRLLDSWHVQVVDKTIHIRWNYPEAERIYGYTVRRFGNVFMRGSI